MQQLALTPDEICYLNKMFFHLKMSNFSDQTFDRLDNKISNLVFLLPIEPTFIFLESSMNTMPIQKRKRPTRNYYANH